MKKNLKEKNRGKNRNYIKGRAKEYKIKNQLQKDGYEVLRTAGSHGFADLIAIEPINKEIYFIQVKPKNFPEKKINLLKQENLKYTGNFSVGFILVSEGIKIKPKNKT